MPPSILHAGKLDFVKPATKGGVESARVQVRAQKLLQLCFNALVTNSSALGLQSHADQHKPDSSSVSWHKLLELIIKLTGDTRPPDSFNLSHSGLHAHMLGCDHKCAYLLRISTLGSVVHC